MKSNILFPIIRHVVYHGIEYEKKLDEGEVVRCRFCGTTFPLNKRTVYMAEDEMQMTRCPECRRNVSILYFFDNTVKDTDKIPFPKNKKKSETSRTYFHSQEYEKSHGYLEFLK